MNWLWEVKRFGDLYIAAGDRATIMTSSEGIDWDLELVPDSATNSIFLGVGGTTNLAVAVGNAGTIIYSPNDKRQITTTNPDGSISTNEASTFGIIWKAVEPRPTPNDLQGITASGDRIVVCGAGGTILSSSDMVTWTEHSSPVQTFLSSVAAFPDGLVAVGSRGTILRSPDGTTWTQQTSGTTNWLFRVRYTGGLLLAVGQNGTILTSSDGLQWARQESGIEQWLNDVIWVEGRYFAVGNRGSVLTSTDSRQWSSIGTITRNSLYGVAQHDGQVLIAGLGGSILRTRVRPLPDPILFQYTHGVSADNVNTNRFIFSGNRDQRFRLDHSSDLLHWESGPRFEFFSDSELILHSEEHQNAGSKRFFRITPEK